MTKIKDILGKAFKIANDKEYTVKIFRENEIRNIETQKLTYLQLGTVLVNNHPIIYEVHIIYKDKVD